MPVDYRINMKDETTPFPHYWEQCVGSCHAYTGLREDWRKQLKKCHDELGFQYIRFHGLLNDDMSVCTRKPSFGKPSDELRYSFFNVDSVFEYLLEIGMKPFIELGFMPEALASGSETCFYYKANITPPKDYNQWEELVSLLVNHLVERYGQEEVRTWFFEVWNEPNLGYFWAGTQEDYFRLYKHAVKAIKAVDPQLRVGGPATSINAWIPDMIEFCRSSGTPLDFVSTHHYPTDDPLWKNSDMSIEEFFKQFASEMGKYERGTLYKMTAKTKAEAGSLPLYYTEWNTSGSSSDELHDESYSAALVAKTIADNQGLVEGYSFWTFSDIFEEHGQPSTPFHGGFGLQTIHGIPKPTYRLFQILHGMGDKRLKVEGEGHPTVEILATDDGDGITVLAYNHQVPGQPVSEEDVTVSIKGLVPGKVAAITIIDEDNTNPKRRWVELGCPEYPSAAELQEILEASALESSKLEIEYNGDEGVIRFKLPPHGVAAVEI